jgi:hypothetical protein
VRPDNWYASWIAVIGAVVESVYVTGDARLTVKMVEVDDIDCPQLSGDLSADTRSLQL